MSTHSHSQHRSSTRSSDSAIAQQPRPFTNPQQEHQQPQTYDLSQVNLFSHDPGPRSVQTLLQAKPAPVSTSVQEQETEVKDTTQAKSETGNTDLATPPQPPSNPGQPESNPVPSQSLPLSGSLSPGFAHLDLFSHAPRRAPIQMKLTVGEPGDRYEQEADRVAEQVMSMPDLPTQQPIQRETALEEEELQTKPQAASMEAVQTKASLQWAIDGSLQAGGNLESRLNSSQGGGSPLPQDVKGFMESRFRTNFSQVRVHTDSEAVQMNRDLNAQAFTHKQDVYFGAGKAPEKDALTAHELTHVVQQNGEIQNKESCNIQQFNDTPIDKNPFINLKATDIDTQVGHPTLSQGSTGPYVFELQQKLQTQAPDLETDSKFGPITRSEVERFQADLSHVDEDGKPLKVDGIVGKHTWSALDIQAAAPPISPPSQGRISFDVLEWISRAFGNPEPIFSRHFVQTGIIDYMEVKGTVRIHGNKQPYQIGMTQTQQNCLIQVNYSGQEPRYGNTIRFYNVNSPMRDADKEDEVWYDPHYVRSLPKSGSKSKVELYDGPGESIEKQIFNHSKPGKPINYLRSIIDRASFVTFLTAKQPDGTMLPNPLAYAIWQNEIEYEFTPNFNDPESSWEKHGKVHAIPGTKGMGGSSSDYFSTPGKTANDHVRNKSNWNTIYF